MEDLFSETLYRDEFMWIRAAKMHSILWVIRSSAPYKTLSDASATVDGMRGLLNRGVSATKLLFDTRLVPLRSDPTFEEFSRKHFDPLLARFAHVAILVATATGKLQLNRIRRENGGTFEVFASFDEAVVHLQKASTQGAVNKR
ncbi:MAG: hypothetical protein Q8Q09_00370 [Deltaproteobacteria bacterium]|nr:hypothetical protein [Deltaproteobacteria bacterium]